MKKIWKILPSLSVSVLDMAFSSILCILLCTVIHIDQTYGQSHCDAKIYGKLNDRDCFDLYHQLPGETLSPDVDPDVPRSFVEPKFLDPPFAPVPNPYPSQMVQLPKIWRIGRLYCINTMSVSC